MEDLQEFERYMAHLSEGLGHSDRHAGLRGYTTGLMSPLQRKSVEPMAALVEPLRVRSRHQSLHHFVADANWSDERMLLGICQWVVPLMDFSDGGWWIIDDTGFPKKGRHSVGVTRQYCGQLGKQDNCQVAVSLSLANRDASLPVAYRLYLPEDWAKDQDLRHKAKIPEEIAFQTKPQIALEQIKAARAAGLPEGLVLMDAGYGNDTELRTAITALGISYVAGILTTTTVWPPGTAPLLPQTRSRRGRPQTRLQRDSEHRPISAKALALSLPKEAWQTVAWREGSAERLSSRFARQRVRAAHRDTAMSQPRAEEWLLIEWPENETEPTKYWLATLPEDIAFDRLVDLTKLRWRIERDYQELKQELGLGEYEGRGWRGFHHHATLCIAAYGFLIAERGALPPQDQASPRRSRDLPFPRITDPEAPPIRPERHIPNSIATMRRRLIVALARTLPRCPCCNASIRRPSRIPDY